MPPATATHKPARNWGYAAALLAMAAACLSTLWYMQKREKQKRKLPSQRTTRTEAQFKTFFQEYVIPETDIENSATPRLPPDGTADACTAAEPKLCDMNLDLYAACDTCSNRRARCVHVDLPTEYIDADGAKQTLAPNANADEGYCLAADKANAFCNLIHGSQVLTEPDPDTGVATIICTCRNAGYIGNEHLDGACDTPFICDGKVVDINVPFEQIECVCPRGTKPIPYDAASGTPPHCGPTPLIDAAPDYPSAFRVVSAPLDGDPNWVVHSGALVPTKVFADDISGNVPAGVLPNPCMFCAITGHWTDGVLIHNEKADIARCVSGGLYGVPYTIDGQTGDGNLRNRVLRGKYGPDCILAIKPASILIYPYFIDDGTFQPKQVIMFDTTEPRNKDIADKLFGPNRPQFMTIDLTRGNNTLPGGMYLASETELPIAHCRSHDPNGAVDIYCACAVVDKNISALQSREYWDARGLDIPSFSDPTKDLKADYDSYLAGIEPKKDMEKALPNLDINKKYDLYTDDYLGKHTDTMVTGYPPVEFYALQVEQGVGPGGRSVILFADGSVLSDEQNEYPANLCPRDVFDQLQGENKTAFSLVEYGVDQPGVTPGYVFRLHPNFTATHHDEYGNITTEHIFAQSIAFVPTKTSTGPNNCEKVYLKTVVYWRPQRGAPFADVAAYNVYPATRDGVQIAELKSYKKPYG